jgi:diguanylate cyclase (GGDEF)-like protein/PAS domain S-box-containing protein
LSDRPASDADQVRRQRLLWGLVFAGFASFAVAWILLSNDRDRATQALMERNELTLEVSWKATQALQRNSVSTYFEEYVLDPRTIALLRAAQDPADRDLARLELFRHLNPAYERMVERGVRQFHFHLPNGDSFLRFHYPARFGDNLFDVRESIRLANTQLKPVFGFEAGRVVSGYRSVFPISDPDGTHLGSVELSMPFKALLEELRALMPQHEFQLLLDTEKQRAVLFDEQQSLYEPWPASDEFLVEDPHRLRPDSPPPLPDFVVGIINQLSQRADALEAIRSDENPGLRVDLADREFAILRVPVLDPLGEQVGLLVSYVEEPELGAIDRSFSLRLGIVTVVLVALFAVLFVLFRLLDSRLSERRRLRIVSDTMGQGLYLTDAEGRIVSMNPQACQQLGYSESDVVGQSAHDLFHKHERNDYLPEERCPIFHNALAEGEFRGETYFQKADGQLIEVAIVSKAFSTSSAGRESLAGAVTVFEDIGQRKHAERELTESRQRLANIVWGTGVGTWEWNVQTGEARFNERWAELIGYQLDELEPISIATWQQVCHPEDFERSEQALKQHFAGKTKHYEAEVRVRHRDGHWIWVLDRGRLVSRTDDGKPEWMVGTHLEITERKLAEQRLEQSEVKYRNLVENAPVVLFRTEASPPWALQHVSRGTERICGYSAEQFMRGEVTWGNIVFAQDRIAVMQIRRAAVEENRRYETEYRLYHQDGSIHWVNEVASVIDAEGGLPRIEGVITDITDRKRAEDEARQARALLQAALDSSPSGIVIANASDGSARFVNPAAEDFLGAPLDEVASSVRKQDGTILWQSLRPNGTPMPTEELPLMRAMRTGHQISAEELIHESGNGERRWLTVSAAPIFDQAGQIDAGIVVFSDITAQKDAEAELRRRAHYDALTDLPNRVLLADRLEQEMSRARRTRQLLAVAFIDLDEFKPINDQYGHSVGDKLLIKVSHRMRQVLREVDTLARLGGDEFVAVLSDLQAPEDANVLLERFVKELAAPFEIDRHSVRVTCSIGLTFYRLDQDIDADQLIRQADQAMYEAKQEGRNRWKLFEPRKK